MAKFEDALKHVEESTITFKIPLISNPKKAVWIRPLKTKDQKLAIIAKDEGEGNPLLNFENLIDLLDAVIVKQDVALGDMTIPDFVNLLIALRIKSLGEIIELKLPCRTATCQEKVKVDFDLVKDMKMVPPPASFKDNILTITDKMKFILGELTVDDMHEILKGADETTEQAITMASILKDVEFEGELITDLTLAQKVTLCGEMTEEQTKKFEAFGKTNDYGPRVSKKYTCPKCNATHEEAFNGFDIINFF